MYLHSKLSILALLGLSLVSLSCGQDLIDTEVRLSDCEYEFRTLDGKCTNNIDTELGSIGIAVSSLFRFRSSRRPSGTGLPSARFISNTVSKQDGDVLNDRGLNELVTFFGQFIDHTVIFTPLSQDRMDIPIPADDDIFGNFTGGVLEFRRSERVPLSPGSRRERPVNELTAALDLASVYGVEEDRNHELRTLTDGKLKTSAGNLLPLNTAGLPNAPSTSSNFFLAGDERANENPSLSALHTLFVLEHNDICEELMSAFPTWTDEQLYENARKINIAEFQKIVYEEFFPALVGKRIRRYRGFKADSDVGVLNEFSTAAFRVGHTLVGNAIHRTGPNNSPLPDIPFGEMFFRSVDVLQNSGIEEFIRGATQFEAQEVDLKVHDALRNGLFQGIPGEDAGFDLIALNLQRARDHSVRSYNQVRRRVGLGRARSFARISRNVNVQNALSTAYGGDVDAVEAWVGMMAEDHENGSSFGPTLRRVWDKQFRLFRDGDRFFYLNDIFSSEIRNAVPRINALRTERETLRGMIIRNSDITDSELPSRIFFV